MQSAKSLINRYKTASFVVERRLSAMFREQMTEGITLDQYQTLQYLSSHGPCCTSTELAETFCVGKSSITAIINRLTDKQLIKRIPEQKDRRVINLALTSEGEKLCEQMGEILEELIGSYMNHFEEKEIVQFIETFEKLAGALQKS